MARFKNRDWNVGDADRDGRFTYDQIQTSLLMDIRDELQRLNNLLHCGNFTGMPHTLKRIDRRLAQTNKLPKGRTKG